MFKNLIKFLASSIGENMASLRQKLGYSANTSFYTVIGGKDIRLSVLLAVCKACNCDVIITNHSTININLADYVAEQSKTE